MKEFKLFVINYIFSLIVVLLIYFISKYIFDFKGFTSIHLAVMIATSSIICPIIPFYKRFRKKHNN